MGLSTELKNYIKLSATNHIDHLLRPLTDSFGIDYFLYIKEGKEGARYWLTNRGDWQEYFYEYNHYEISAFENPYMERLPGYYLWSQLKGQKVFSIAREQFNIAHGLTVVEKLKDGYEFFHFGTSRKNTGVIQLYVDYQDIIRRYIFYFKQRAADLITLSEKNSVVVPMPSNVMPEQKLAIEMGDNHPEQFFKQISCDRFVVSAEEEIYLTKREAECIDWSIKGKTSEEIAMIFGLSKRTVESHLNNIKAKLRCYKQFQLGYKLGKSGLF